MLIGLQRATLLGPQETATIFTESILVLIRTHSISRDQGETLNFYIKPLWRAYIILMYPINDHELVTNL